MIDFRYHLVSLVSVFLALAVGIVLGAGPLKGTIAESLTKNVDILRQEKEALHGELDTAQASLAHRDTFTTAVTPSLVSGQLAGRSVAVVSLPGADGDAVDPLVDAITTAGGQVTGRISLSGAWVDPNRADDRAKAVAGLVKELPAGTVPVDGDPENQLAGLLSNALVSTGAGLIGQKTTVSSAVLKSLRSADLIAIKGDVSGLAGSALVLAPPNPDGSDQKAKPTPSKDVAQSAYLGLVTALDTVGGGAVVTGPASAATGEGLLAAIRQDDTAKSAVSTVDTGSTPMGVITAVLALREQLAGGSGAYGFVGGGTKPLPALAADAPGGTQPTAPTK
jgi:Copper transport outer membrane protein, MctB